MPPKIPRQKKIETDNVSSENAANISDTFSDKVENINLSETSVKDSVNEVNMVSECDSEISFKEIFNHSLCDKKRESVVRSETTKRKASESPPRDSDTAKPTKTFRAAMKPLRTAPATVAGPSHQTLLLRNRYAPLSDLDDADGEASEDDAALNARSAPNVPLRKYAPAPIIIPGRVTDHRALVNKLDATAKQGYNIKYTRNNVSLYLDSKEEKDKFLQIIKPNVQYHTYSDSNEKSHAFVLRGLDWEPTTDCVKEELESNYEIKIKAVYRMTTQFRPLYLIITTSDMTLKQIQQNITKILFTRVSWERHMNKKILTQCHRCQGWGHATTNCNREPKCVKCALGHLTTACTKTRDTPAKCVNCGGAHPANAVICEAYIRKVNEVGKRNPRVLQRYEDFKLQRAQRDGTAPAPPVTYVPAPEPTVNSWTHRRQQSQQHVARAQTAVSVPNINDHARFPSLPQRRHEPSAERPSLQQPTPLPQTVPTSSSQDPAKQQQTIYETADIFKQLSEAIILMNSMINLSNLLKFVNDLNVELSKCNSTQSRASTTMTFMNHIDSYHI